MDYAKRSLLRLAASVTLLGAPLALQGQERTAAPREPESKSHYATEQPEDNGLAVELHSASSWDNNILGDNAHRIHDGLVRPVQNLVDAIVVEFSRRARARPLTERREHEGHVVLDVRVDPQQHVLPRVDLPGARGVEGDLPRGRDRATPFSGADRVEVDVREQGVLDVQVARVAEEVRLLAERLPERPGQLEVRRREDGAVRAPEPPLERPEPLDLHVHLCQVRGSSDASSRSRSRAGIPTQSGRWPTS